ncbi:putative NADH-dependent oxidoreductase-possiblyglucose-fructose dependent oxidoreductase [Lunatimonas lonarensis]|uniref:Putative NADH-dependent oxidoreductase-possiblyglucose-fructose dependent oxidoreductase n=1 Tax=Lunatimonas lonarensis TaxID=1232681 RepID=R7ZSK4_9BACT|nr:Gfo/Idh/MocA family oxidoreductase [Lunatimonas lonarensis]EON77067.1 putative NADH-dependent oxidoreductase-possiblyglucose-fructose dependent oxidoreductase [Lunatimonas lonarensis]
MSDQKITVVIVGMGFGKEFIPIYQSHPNIKEVGICTRNPKTLDELATRFNLNRDLCFTDFEEVPKRDDVDAIHIVTPVPEHAKMTLASLNAHKHTACTIPMAMTVEDCKAIVEAKKRVNKVYMMMETALYTREFLYGLNLADTGKLGKIQFVRGSHIQDMSMEGWAEYWKGFPPMLNGTHAISPLLRINNTKAETVVCHGSGRLSEDLAKRYGSPFAVETATFTLKNSDVVAEATRSLFDVVRQYRESYDVYGTKMSFEWEQLADEHHVVFPGGEDAERIEVPDTDELLIEPIKHFTKREKIDDPNHVSFLQGAGHGGSHPHLVQEFVAAIVEGRDSAVDADLAANYTCAGICAHESAMNGGKRITIPDFED